MAFIKHTFTPASLTMQSLWLCGSKSKLWKILKEMEIIDHLTCLLRNLYANQEATVRTLHGTTDSFQTGRELWQGCVLSPCLFNFYAEYIMWHAKLDEAQAGIKIARRNVNNLRYADDTTLMEENEEELKSLLIKVKLKSWHVVPSLHSNRRGKWKQWHIFFSGSKITLDSDCSHEIKRSLLLGRKVVTNLDSVLKSREITLPTKTHTVKVMVFPVVMYGCESWTIKKAEYQRVDAFELWC